MNKRQIICTITDKTFEVGCMTLINSLFYRGFHGLVRIGLLGSGHSIQSRLEQYKNALSPIDFEFVKLQDGRNPNFFKPGMIRGAFDSSDASDVYFFDADIVCTEDWTFFEEWLDCGVAVCSDVNFLWMPPDHPRRRNWVRLLSDLGRNTRSVTGYANGGFIGIRRNQLELIELWQSLLDWVDGDLHFDTNVRPNDLGFNKFDQDLLNLALMGTDVPIAFAGHEGMSFNSSIGYMVHAIGKRKPWNKGYLKTLLIEGRGLPLSAREYWKHTVHPIEVYNRSERIAAKVEMDVTAAFSRIIRR